MSGSQGGKPGLRVYVGNVGLATSQKDVEEAFSKYGPFTVQMCRNFAFLQFPEVGAATAAVNEMNGTSHFSGRKLEVQFAKSSRNSGPEKKNDESPRDRSPIGGNRGGGRGGGHFNSRLPFGRSDGPPSGPFGRNDAPPSGPFGRNDGPPNPPFGRNDPPSGPFGRNDGPPPGPFGRNENPPSGPFSDSSFRDGDRPDWRNNAPGDSWGGNDFRGGNGDFRRGPDFRGSGPSPGNDFRGPPGPDFRGGMDMGPRGSGDGPRGGGDGGSRMGDMGPRGPRPTPLMSRDIPVPPRGDMREGPGFRGSGPNPWNSGAPVPTPQGPPHHQEDPPTSDPIPLSTPNSERTNDVEILVMSRGFRDYGEFVESRLKSAGFTVDLMFPKESFVVRRVLANIASRGTLYAIVIYPEHQTNRSLTLHILHGTPQEHRNMPLDDAIVFLNRNYEQYTRRIDESKSATAPPEQVRHLLENVLKGLRPLTPAQFDILVQWFLQEKLKVESSNPTGDASIPVSQQAELQTRILSILNKTSAPPSQPAPPTNLAGGGEAAPPLLKDPTVQRALDSLIQGGNQLFNFNNSNNRF